MPDDRALGVFDSGVGGLTVVRAINDLLPGEAVRYVGDTARSPYGPRPVAEIRRFALEIADHLARTAVKMLVVACNSIEVSAIEDVARAHGLPVVGVIAPGIRAAARATRSGRVGLIGTHATVTSGAYDRAAADEGSGISLVSAACPVFVDHVEAGDTSSPTLRAAAEVYRHWSNLGEPGESVPRNTDSEHKGIVDAVLARDTEKAVRLLDQHLRHTARRAVARLAVADVAQLREAGIAWGWCSPLRIWGTRITGSNSSLRRRVADRSPSV